MTEVITKFDILDHIDEISIYDRDIGEAIVLEIKELIAAGVSPVTGDRFAPYKAVAGIRGSRKRLKHIRAIQKLAAHNGDTKSFERALLKELNEKESISTALSKGYPYSVQKKFPDKTITPVNLELTGEMLSYLTSDNIGNALYVGFPDSAPSNIRTIADAHNEGPTNDAFPQRRMIPTDSGEEFSISVMRKIVDLYTEKLSNIIYKSK